MTRSELKEACELVESASTSCEMVQVLREMLPELGPDQCPVGAQEEWLELHLMVQPRPVRAAGIGWFSRLSDWMSKLSLPAKPPRCVLARVRV